MNRFIFTVLSFCFFTGISSCSKKIIPEKPTVYTSDYKLDTLPLSEIDIPVKISLQPLYDLAEKKVDLIYTSDNYPNLWQYDGCDTRYMYQFKRDKLRISTKSNVLRLSFSGFYKVKGSQRACLEIQELLHGRLIVPAVIKKNQEG